MIIFYKELKYALLQNLFGNKIHLLKYDCIKPILRIRIKKQILWLKPFQNTHKTPS